MDEKLKEYLNAIDDVLIVACGRCTTISEEDEVKAAYEA